MGAGGGGGGLLQLRFESVLMKVLHVKIELQGTGRVTGSLDENWGRGDAV